MLATTVLHSPVPAIGPRPCIQVTHKGGRGVECAVQRPKYNSPELLLLLPRGSCQPGGAQPRCSGWQPGPSQPDLNLVQGPRQPPQLEPRTPPTGSARRQRCNQIFRSVNATDCLSFLLFRPFFHHSRRSFNGGRSVDKSGAAMRHTTVSPRNPFCVAWGGSGRGRGVHRVVDVGHAEYRAGGRLAAECTLHCWHTVLCNCWHPALHRIAGWSDTELAQHGLQQEKSGGSKPGLRRRWRDRGETGSGGGDAPPSATHTCQYVCNAPPPRTCLH